MDWQTLIAWICVLIAAFWLVRRIVRIVKSGSRDGEGHMSSCGHCPRNPSAAATEPLVSLGVQPKAKR